MTDVQELRRQLGDLELRCAGLVRRIEAATGNSRAAATQYKLLRREARTFMGQARTAQAVAFRFSKELAGLRPELRRVQRQLESVEYAAGNDDPAVVALRSSVHAIRETLTAYADGGAEP